MKLNRRATLTGFILVLLIIITVNQAGGAPAAKLWSYWLAHDPDSVVAVDHRDWDNILKRYVDARHPSGINRFHYGNVLEQDKYALKNYLKNQCICLV